LPTNSEARLSQTSTADKSKKKSVKSWSWCLVEELLKNG